jgi:hypothetical protein
VHGQATVPAGLRVAARQGAEDGRLARLRQPDDGDLHDAFSAPGQ